MAEQSRIVRLPLNRVGALHRIGKAYRNLEQDFEREPSAEELAKELDMDISEVSDALTSPGKHLSVDAPFASGDENSLLDVLENEELPSPDNLLNSESLKAEIARVLSVLSERESEVIKLYFGLDKEQAHTLEEIGDKFNLTRERVRQIKEKAIRRLKRTSLSNDLRTYLG